MALVLEYLRGTKSHQAIKMTIRRIDKIKLKKLMRTQIRSKDPSVVAQRVSDLIRDNILAHYNFVGVTERMF